jgi:hypothetical protein
VKNAFLSAPTAADIEDQVEKILRGLGNPEPPLRLDDVRALLKLDRQYYTTNDAGLMAETLSRLRIAAKQVIARPTLILDAIRKWEVQAFYLPDRKRILIDQAVPSAKHRWIEGHEITHGILPWHAELMLGDTDHTLRPLCHEHLESEANYGAGQLLFLRGRFVAEARDLPPTLETVRRLAKTFGNTLTSTLWRFIESVHGERLVCGAITAHPSPAFQPDDFDPANPCRYFIRSPAFARQFSRATERDMFAAIASYCMARRGGTLGDAEIPIRDDADREHVFAFETFYNQHDALTLAVRVRLRATIVEARGMERNA